MIEQVKIDEEVTSLIGHQTIQIILLQKQLAAAQKRIAELEPKTEKPKLETVQ